MWMKGMSIASIKQHPSLIPLFVALGASVTMATLYPIRVALKSPDVTWNRKKNPEPWQEYHNKHYKLYTTPNMKKVVFAQPPKY